MAEAPSVAPAVPERPEPPKSGMGSIGRHAILYAIGNILTKGIAFVMLPIYTRYLTPADYGIAALIEMTLDVVGIIAGAQIAQGVFRFYHKADNPEDKRAVVATTFTALIISYFVMGAIVFFASDAISRLVFDSDTHGDLIRLAAGSFALQSFILVPMVLGRVQERSMLVVGSSVAKILISVALNLVFVVAMQLGVRGVMLSTLGANLLIGTWLGVWSIRQVGLRIDSRVLKDLVRYGVPLIGVQAATFTMTFSDRYFLQGAGGEATVGLYNLAYQFGFLLLMLGFVPIEMVWGPRRFQVARSPNPSPVLAKAFRLINVSVLTIGVGIALFVGDLLRVMSTPAFHSAADVVPIILVAYVFHGWAMMHDIGVLVNERTEFLTIANWAAALVALGALALLVPPYLEYGAAVAAVLAFSVRWGLTYVFSQRLWKVDYEWAPVIRLALVAGAVTIVGALLPSLPIVASIAIHAVMFGVYGLIVWAMPILTPAEKQGAIALSQRALGMLRRRSGGKAEAGTAP